MTREIFLGPRSAEFVEAVVDGQAGGVLKYRSLKKTRQHTMRSKVLEASGSTLIFAGAMLAIGSTPGVFFEGEDVSYLVNLLSSESAELSSGVLLLIVFALWAVGILVFIYGSWLVARSLRMRFLSASEAVAVADFPPVLYLRNFRDEKLRIDWRAFGLFSCSFFSSELEVVIEEGFGSVGPFVAIADPTEDEPLLSAMRDRVSDLEWKERAAALIRNSSVIVVVLSNSAGLEWEIREIQHSALRKALFVVPPIREDPRVSRRAYLESIRRRVVAINSPVVRSSLGLSGIKKDCIMFFMGENSQWTFIRSSTTDRDQYRMGIDAFKKCLQRQLLHHWKLKVEARR